MRDNEQGSSVRLKDYQPPAYLVDHVELDFDLHDDRTEVLATLSLRRNPASPRGESECRLDGVGLALNAIMLDEAPLAVARYRYDGKVLVINDVPDSFSLTTRVTIRPQDNTSLEGLYVSRGMFCTQCEAEGFRHITFFPDRPDVLSRFTTTVRGEQGRFPLLLSNGNPVAKGEQGDRHWCRWEDPFPKPCYLFALVAGDLACHEDVFVTGSGREVALKIYAEPRDLDKLSHAMDSLKRAMRWDEQQYGREYDLDLYMIVAVSHFNMGAMENKGLNVFNTACVLAHPQTTTDAGFQRVEAVVAHEYFHNWSGNRVTCRDWFQLSLKEGFTVFRDQSFSADMHSAAVKRIEDVNLLRTVQFAEDAGPMAHPVRPDTYQKIDNFYTVTIYEKGAELVRMQYNLLGAEAFRRASDLYFERFDGQAVTCDDFVDCMEEASGLDLSRFRRWYEQAGTPHVTVTDSYEAGVYRLTLSQQTPPSPSQPDKRALMIPFALSLLDEQGNKLPLEGGAEEAVLILQETEQSWAFPAAVRPVPSMLRGFSAPVHLHYAYTAAQLLHLLQYDDDGFVRWNAAQQLYHDAVQRVVQGADAVQEARAIAPALLAVLAQAEADAAGAALILELPSETALGEKFTPLDPGVVAQARRALQAAIGRELLAAWRALPERFVQSGYKLDAASIGARSLLQRGLQYRAAAGDETVAGVLRASFDEADNMTTRLGALRLMVWHALPGWQDASEAFLARWRDEALVIDQWFSVHAGKPGLTRSELDALLAHDAFDWRTPNRVRAVLSTFANQNLTAFHSPAGDGYQVFSESLSRLDKINPQIAARLAGALAILPRLEPARRAALEGCVRALREGALSDNLAEVLDRILSTTAVE